MIQISLEIIQEFEKNYSIPISIGDWDNEKELIALYISAKNYLNKHQ